MLVTLTEQEIYRAFSSLPECDRDSINDSVDRILDHIQLMRSGPTPPVVTRNDVFELLYKIGLRIMFVS